MPDFQDLSAAAAWARVMDTLHRHAGPGQQQGLYLAALRAALQQERLLKLPAPLLAPFQVRATFCVVKKRNADKFACLASLIRLITCNEATETSTWTLNIQSAQGISPTLNDQSQQ